MCLTLNRNSKRPYAPYKKGVRTVRWKMVKCVVGAYYAPYMSQRYPLRKWMEADWKGLSKDTAGFHVYASREQAIEHLNNKNIHVEEQYQLAKVYVRGFLRSGTFLNRKSETWKEMKILSAEKISNITFTI